MKWIYLPKTRERSFLFEKDKPFRRIYNRRQNKPKEVYRLVHLIVGLYMLWFAISLGPIIPLVLGDSSALQGAIIYAEGITLPESTYREESTLSRSQIYIVIDRYGKTELGGKLMPTSDMIEFLRQSLYEQPKAFPVFIVDKATPMKYVTPMIQLIRKAGFRRIKFSTSKEKLNDTGT